MEIISLERLNAARKSRKAVIHFTDIVSGQGRIIVEGEAVNAAFDETVSNAFRSGKSLIVAADGRQYFLNVYLPPARIVAIGAVHIA